jgi:hypothetical protein
MGETIRETIQSGEAMGETIQSGEAMGETIQSGEAMGETIQSALRKKCSCDRMQYRNELDDRDVRRI